ncbi:MAG: hypothetical protein AAAC48_25840 [Phyllobacterium sp.]
MAKKFDLAFLAKKMDQLLTEFGSLRDEVIVLSAMVNRIDSIVDG